MKDYTNCSCGEELPLRILESAAGYYLGYFCPKCGPYDRVSGYYASYEDAEAALILARELGDQPDEYWEDFHAGVFN